MKNKIIVSTLFFLILSMTIAQYSLAATGVDNLNTAIDSTKTGLTITRTTFPMFVGTLIKSILSIIGVLFICYIIWAGFIWMGAGNDSKLTTKAKNMIMAAIIGLVIILTSYIVVNYLLTGTNLFSETDGSAEK